MDFVENDHDRLIVTMQAVKTQSEAFLAHIKENKENFTAHVKDNEADFNRMKESLGKLEKIVWIFLGVGMAVQGLPLIQTVLKVLNP